MTLALAYDIDALADRKLLPLDWAEEAAEQRQPPTRRPSCSWCARATPRPAAAPVGTTWRPGAMRSTKAVRPLIAWENEAYLAVKELGPDKFEVVTPSLSCTGREASPGSTTHNGGHARSWPPLFLAGCRMAASACSRSALSSSSR